MAVPPPTRGSLQKMMSDPNLRAMMMGAIQGTGTTDEELKRLALATQAKSAYAQIGQGLEDASSNQPSQGSTSRRLSAEADPVG